MRQLRRLDVSTPQDAYGKLRHGVLRQAFLLSETDYEALQRERPELIVEEGEAVLMGQPRNLRIELHYGFPSRDAFTHQFPALFQRLAAAVSQDQAPLGFRLALTDRSSRPYVEPVLFAQAFEVSREWMRMTLPGLPDDEPPDDEVASGFLLRPAQPNDAEAIAELAGAAYSMPDLTAETARQMASQALVLHVLEESASGRAAGLLRLRIESPGVGYVSDVVVHPDLHRRGLGEAMMRWSFGWFRGEGLRRAALTVNLDNAPAIALYRKLGFTGGEVGIDYRRPIDEEEVRQVLEKHRGAHIKFGGWR